MPINNGKELIEDLILEEELNKWDRFEEEKRYNEKPEKSIEGIKEDIPPVSQKNTEKTAPKKEIEAATSQKEKPPKLTKQIESENSSQSPGFIFKNENKSEKRVLHMAETMEKTPPEIKTPNKEYSDMEVLEKPAQIEQEKTSRENNPVMGAFKKLKNTFIGKILPVAEKSYAKIYKYDINKRPQEQIVDLKKNVYDDGYIAALKARAESEDVPAMNELGVVYFSLGDTKEAEKYFAQAAAVGSYIAQRNLAITMENNHSSKLGEIFSLYDSAAAENDVIAINNLGCCYLNGEGTAQNYEKAIECFERAAALKDDLALLNLATCYSFGLGIDKNLQKALELYKQAADLGNDTAVKMIADSYYYGRVVKQDT
ncbi:MAG: sel1 repeat family protein, partial [Eubacterium sp.]|nr:sel1 repeat family protein [Eubacterium sp.]